MSQAEWMEIVLGVMSAVWTVVLSSLYSATQLDRPILS